MSDQWLQMPVSPRSGAFQGSPMGCAAVCPTEQRPRTRFLTDETPPIHNLSFEARSMMNNQPKCLSMTRDNPFRSFGDGGENEDGSCVRVCSAEINSPHGSPLRAVEDGASEVSSISYDSLKRYINTPNGASPSSMQLDSREPPPHEINVPASHTARIVPDWLCSSDQMSVVTEGNFQAWETGEISRTPQRPPSVKRGHSANTPPPQRPSGIKRGLSASSLGSGGNSPPVAIYRDPPLATPSKAGTGVSVAAYVPSTRPRRPHNRGHSLAFSIGSLVGQSSYLTEPTTTSMSTYECESSVVGKPFKSNRGHHHRRVQSCHGMISASFECGGEGAVLTAEKPPRTRRRNPVKQEMLYVLGKVTKPVKNLVCCSNKPTCDLRRSAGCLT